MTCRARQNSIWQQQVRSMIRDGYGVEDISIIKGFNLSSVQVEVGILRASGELNELFEGDEV